METRNAFTKVTHHHHKQFFARRGKQTSTTLQVWRVIAVLFPQGLNCYMWLKLWQQSMSLIWAISDLQLAKGRHKILLCSKIHHQSTSTTSKLQQLTLLLMKHTSQVWGNVFFIWQCKYLLSEPVTVKRSHIVATEIFMSMSLCS